MHQDQKWDHSVIGYKGDPFFIRGDSGALIFDRSLGVIGLIFGEHTTWNATYITLRNETIQRHQGKDWSSGHPDL